MNKKILKISLVIALTAGIVALHSCKKDKLTPEQDGRNLAKELCSCFTNATNDDVRLACFTDFENNANKWKDSNDRKALQTAFDEAIQTCGASPYDWYYTHLAAIAVAEFCALAAEHPNGDAMTLAPLYMKYETLLNSGNPAFLNPFFGGLMACSPASDWILCFFRMTDFCPPLTDEELIALATEAIPEFCQYFTENPEANMDSMLASDLAIYANYFSFPAFIETLLQGLSTCSSTPLWFICIMTGGTAPGC
ncbi:MAG: hypothetical protein FWE63_07290 [Bacteroidales bacterium]|nr:hypothetical protein [Bacteroidales bacterium]